MAENGVDVCLLMFVTRVIGVFMRCLTWMRMVRPISQVLYEVGNLSSDSSERRHKEPKSWLRFEDVVHCRDIASLNEFIQQYLSERGLIGEKRERAYWALVYAWKNGIGSYR